MNCRQKKKIRKKLYQKLIEDVALEISIDSYWRKALREKPFNEKLDITYRYPDKLPTYIRKTIVYYQLEFEVMRVTSCNEYFDKGLEIFSFQSKEFPALLRYTGNNPHV